MTVEATESEAVSVPTTEEDIVAMVLQQDEADARAPDEQAPEAEPEPADDEPEGDDEAPEAADEDTDDDADAEEEETEAADEPEIELEPIAPPIHFDAEAKEKFAKLPRDMQEIVSAQVTQSMKHADRITTEASEAKKAYETGLTAYKAKLDQVLPQAEAVFGDKWANVDWVAISRNDPGLYVELQAEYAAEMQHMQALQEAKRVADKVAEKQYFEAEKEKLKTLAPELADPEKGRSVWESLTGYLQQEGAPVDAISRMGALEARIALKAMKWDQANAKAKSAAAAPKQQAAQQAAQPVKAKATVRPAASATGVQSTSKARELRRLENRAMETKSNEDIAQYILQRGF